MQQFNNDVHAANQNDNKRQQSEDNAQINRHITPLKHIYFNKGVIICHLNTQTISQNNKQICCQKH